MGSSSGVTPRALPPHGASTLLATAAVVDEDEDGSYSGSMLATLASMAIFELMSSRGLGGLPIDSPPVGDESPLPPRPTAPGTGTDLGGGGGMSPVDRSAELTGCSCWPALPSTRPGSTLYLSIELESNARPSRELLPEIRTHVPPKDDDCIRSSWFFAYLAMRLQTRQFSAVPAPPLRPAPDPTDRVRASLHLR